MAFFIRRAFKVGPVRINLSKSGFGLSAGITGARVGITSQGKPYVAGGRHGLYYRKNLSLNGRGVRRRGRANANTPESEDSRLEQVPVTDMSAGAWRVLKALGGMFLIGCSLVFFAQQPALASVVVSAVALVYGVMVWRKMQGRRLLKAYEDLIQAHVVHGNIPATPATSAQLRQTRAAIFERRHLRSGLHDIETGAYHALMERVSEDHEITDAEAALVSVAETLFEKPESEISSIKRDVFVETYMDYIEDQRIEPGELASLEGYVKRLAIPKAMVQSEIDTINEILRAQRLEWPLTALPRTSLEVNLFQTESAYYSCEAKVLWRKRDRSQPTGYRFDLWRDGTLVMTERRFFVVGGGSTEVRYSEIGDIEVDLETRLVCISKTTSRRPVYLEVGEPLYVGAMLNVLNEAWRRGEVP